MKLEIKYLWIWIFLAGYSSLIYSNQSQAPRQKMFIFLKEPLREEAVTVRINNNLENTMDFEIEEEQSVIISPSYKIVYNAGKQSKRTISLILPQMGLVKLEAFDFYGKHLGTLLEGYCTKGTTMLEENNTWKAFVNFRGVAFFILSVDGKAVLKKLIPIVD